MKSLKQIEFSAKNEGISEFGVEFPKTQECGLVKVGQNGGVYAAIARGARTELNGGVYEAIARDARTELNGGVYEAIARESRSGGNSIASDSRTGQNGGFGLVVLGSEENSELTFHFVFGRNFDKKFGAIFRKSTDFSGNFDNFGLENSEIFGHSEAQIFGATSAVKAILGSENTSQKTAILAGNTNRDEVSEPIFDFVPEPKNKEILGEKDFSVEEFLENSGLVFEESDGIDFCDDNFQLLLSSYCKVSLLLEILEGQKEIARKFQGKIVENIGQNGGICLKIFNSEYMKLLTSLREITKKSPKMMPEIRKKVIDDFRKFFETYEQIYPAYLAEDNGKISKIKEQIRRELEFLVIGFSNFLYKKWYQLDLPSDGVRIKKVKSEIRIELDNFLAEFARFLQDLEAKKLTLSGSFGARMGVDSVQNTSLEEVENAWFFQDFTQKEGANPFRNFGIILENRQKLAESPQSAEGSISEDFARKLDEEFLASSQFSRKNSEKNQGFFSKLGEKFSDIFGKDSDKKSEKSSVRSRKNSVNSAKYSAGSGRQNSPKDSVLSSHGSVCGLEELELSLLENAAPVLDSACSCAEKSEKSGKSGSKIAKKGGFFSRF